MKKIIKTRYQDQSRAHIDNDKYLLNDEVVAYVTDKTALSMSLFDLFKGVALPDKFIKLTYNDNKIDDLFALCLLLVDVSKTFHSMWHWLMCLSYAEAH